jgi:hypothetical protein
VDVTVHFAAAERYVLAPTADSHGVRIRLLRPESSGTRVMIFEHGAPPAGYAINLAASQQPFDDAAIQEATRVTGNPAYLSESRLGDQTWYRLRIGPFETESSARKVLLAVRDAYPKAWLAIGDDEKLNTSDTVNVTPVAPTRPGPVTTLTPQDIEATFRKAKDCVQPQGLCNRDAAADAPSRAAGTSAARRGARAAGAWLASVAGRSRTPRPSTTSICVAIPTVPPPIAYASDCVLCDWPRADRSVPAPRMKMSMPGRSTAARRRPIAATPSRSTTVSSRWTSRARTH